MVSLKSSLSFGPCQTIFIFDTIQHLHYNFSIYCQVLSQQVEKTKFVSAKCVDLPDWIISVTKILWGILHACLWQLDHYNHKKMGVFVCLHALIPFLSHPPGTLAKVFWMPSIIKEIMESAINCAKQLIKTLLI